MKLINEKGKLFGIINVIDLVILLCIILVVGALVYKFVSPAATEMISPKSDMYVTMRVRGAMDYLKEEAEKHLTPGTRLIAGSDYIAGAEVVSFEAIDYYSASEEVSDGNFVNAKDPQKYDLLIKVHAKQSKTDPILKIGTQEIRIGRGFIFKTQTIEVNAIIETVEFDG